MFAKSRITVACAASLAVSGCEMPGDPVLNQNQSSLGSEFSRLRGSNDATNNYYGYSFVGTYDFHRVYIDTDENAATGFASCGLGANYLVENTHVYSYSGDGSSWSWTLLGSVTRSLDTSSVSWTVPRSTVGESAFPNRAKLCFETETATNVSETSGTYIHVYSDETLPIHAQVASNDGTTIYYQANFDVAVNYKHVFIDVDESVSTGFGANGAGAEYMIENSTLYGYTGDGSSWSWSSIGAANMSPSTQGATGTTTWSIARSAIGETGTAERTDLVWHGTPAAGGSSTYTAIYDHIYSGSTGGGGSGTLVDTSYTSDNDATLKNPERGMYFGSVPDTSGEFHTIVPKWLYLDTVCAQSLTWNGYNQTGTTSVLNTYAADLEAARTGGYKILFRPRYDTPGSNAPNPCGLFHADTRTRQLQHIDAVAAMLGDYRDVIAYIEAGYLGRWGEWNTSGYADSTAPLLYSYTDRSAIIDRVLSAYAAEGIAQDVELRRPVFAKEVLDRNSTAKVATQRLLHDHEQ